MSIMSTEVLITSVHVLADSMRPAAFFPPAGLLLLCLGGGCGLAACWGRRRSRRLLFLSGGACIVSGEPSSLLSCIHFPSLPPHYDNFVGTLGIGCHNSFSLTPPSLRAISPHLTLN